jgi:hypothetical protein
MTTPIDDPKFHLVGRKLVLIARDISDKETISGSGTHRTQRVFGRGTKTSPARCYIEIPAVIK